MIEIFEALRYAITKHKDQTRKSSDGKKIPYVVHPLEACQILYECGVRDSDVLVASVLHDVLEDTDATPESLINQFGHEVCSIVQELTDDQSLSKKERKLSQEVRAPYMSRSAQMVKIADKTSNVTDIRRWPPAWSTASKEGYIAQAARVVKLIGSERVPELLWQKFWEAHKWTARTINDTRR